MNKKKKKWKKVSKKNRTKLSPKLPLFSVRDILKCFFADAFSSRRNKDRKNDKRRLTSMQHFDWNWCFFINRTKCIFDMLQTVFTLVVDSRQRFWHFKLALLERCRSTKNKSVGKLGTKRWYFLASLLSVLGAKNLFENKRHKHINCGVKKKIRPPSKNREKIDFRHLKIAIFDFSRKKK